MLGKSILNKKLSFGFVFSTLSIGVEGLAGLVILPLLLGFLSEAIVGLWLFFLSFVGFISLGQAGLGPVVTKLAAAKKITPNLHSNLWGNVTFVYLYSSLIVVIICTIIYFSYISGVLKEENFVYEGTLCWVFLSVSFIIKIFFSKNFHILNGFGEVGLDKMMLIVSALINLVGFYLVLKLGFGFVSLGMVYLSSSAVFAISSVFLVKAYTRKFIDFKFIYEINSIKKIASESVKILVLNLCSFIVLQSNFFIIERLFGLKVLPYYSGLYRVIGLIMAVAAVVSSLFFPFISQAENEGKLQMVRKLFYNNIILSNGLGIFLGITVFLLAPWLIPLWLGENGYLGAGVFGPMIILALIYINHTATANAIIAIGANHFVKPAILNAVLSIPLALFFGYHFGISGVILGNILATIIPSIYVVTWSLRFIKNRIYV